MSFARLWDRTAARYSIVLGGFLVVTVLWTTPLVAHLGSSVFVEPSDGTSTMRDYWAMERQGASPFTFEHDRLMNAPEGTERSAAIQIANAVQPAFVWTTKGIVGIVAALNIFMLAGFALAGLCMFALLDRLRLHPAASLFGAYVYAFNPYMFSKLEAGHGSLVHTWIFPVLVVLLLELRKRRTLRAAAFLGVGVAVAFYLHTYYGLFALVLGAVFTSVELVRDQGRGRTLRLAAASVITAMIIFAPALVAAILDPGAVSQVGHDAGALQSHGARVLAYLLPAQPNPLLGELVHGDTRASLDRASEPTLFFGYTTILLALAGLVLLIRRHAVFSEPARRYLGIAAAMLVPVAFVMSLPRTFHGVPMPSYAIGAVTTTIRVYARFGILVGLGLVILASFALDALLRSRRRATLLAAAAFCLVGVELANHVPAPIWRTDRPPAFVDWLATQPKGIVAFYPSPGDKDAEARFVREQYFFQTVHGQPLFFSGSPRKDRAWAIRALADHVEDEISAGILAAEGIRYVVVDPSVYRATPGEGAPAVPPRLYRQLAQVGGARIYAVTAPPVDLDEVLHEQAARVAAAIGVPKPQVTVPGQGFNELELDADGSPAHWMIQDGFVEVDNPTAAADLELAAKGFSAHKRRRLDLIAGDGSVLASVQVPTNDETIRIGPFRLPKGKHTLRLRADPGPEPLGSSDPRLASVFLSPIDVRPIADYSRR
jgi:hypothetical protein